MGRGPDDKAKIINVDENGNVKVQQSGNIKLDSSDKNIGRVRTQNHEMAGFVYDRIIEEIGPNNLSLLLPLWEESGDFHDLINPEISFEPGDTVVHAADNLLHPVPKSKGIRGWIKQRAVAGFYGGNTEVKLEAGQKLATKIKSPIACMARFLRIHARRVGTLNDATLKISVYDDNAGVPGSEKITSDLISCARISTSTTGNRFYGTRIEGQGWLQGRANDLWLVVEYDDDTGVDVSNYVVLFSGSDAGGAIATHDGSSWVKTDDVSFGFDIYDNSFDLPVDNISLIFTVKFDEDGGDRYLISQAGHRTLENPLPNILRVYMSMDGLWQNEISGVHNANYTSTRPRFAWEKLNKWHTIGLTYDAQTTTAKAYIDGRLVREARSSTTNKPLGAQVQPLVLFSGISANGLIANSQAIEGSAGPIIITNNILSESVMASVHNLLMTGRRLREVE